MQSPTLIDLVITNDQNMMQNIHLLPPLGKSHHSVISNEVDNKGSPNQSSTVKYQMDRGNYTLMREFVNQANWDILVRDETNVNTCWEEIHSVIKEARDKYIPVKNMNPNGKTPHKFAVPEP